MSYILGVRKSFMHFEKYLKKKKKKKPSSQKFQYKGLLHTVDMFI